ncbi:MAG TPA: hypothetical protein VEQ37_06140 [Actinomycetota bacterium]|nr:hypothetical protein [Actinomycetota bacterium]
METGWRYWLAGAAIAIIGYFFVAESTQSVYYDVIGVSASVVMFIGLTRNRAEPRAAWVLLAFGVLILSAGDIAYGDYKPVPSVADMLYLSAYGLLGAGLISLIRGRTPRRHRSAVVDAAAVATSLVVASIVFLGRAYTKDVGMAGRAVAIAYPLMDLVLLGLVVRLALTDRAAKPHHGLLGAAFLLLLVADTGFAFQDFGAAYSVGGALDASWLLAYACFGAAFLHPSIAPERVTPQKVLVGAGVGVGGGGDGGAATSRYSARDPFGSGTAFQALRFRRVLATTGAMALAIAAIALLIGVGWKSTEVIFLAGMYGTTGSVTLIASAVHSFS